MPSESPPPLPAESAERAMQFWLERGRPEKVVEEGRKLLAFDPENSALHAILATSLWSLGCRKEADFHFREALRLDPEDEDFHSTYALFRASPLRTRQADQHALAALAINPESTAALHALAYSALADDPDFSIRCTSRILASEPNHVEARLLLATALSIAEIPGWQDRSEQILREALAIAPENPDVHSALGSHLIGIPHRRKEGEDHLRAALDLGGGQSAMDSHLYEIALHRDWFLRFIHLPRRCLWGTIRGMGKLVERHPWTILLGKFMLAILFMCLAGLLVWFIFLWPVSRIYGSYAIQGQSLRMNLAISRLSPLARLVPASGWARKLIAVALGVGWIMAVPFLLGAPQHIHPKLDEGNLLTFGAFAILGLLILISIWLAVRKRLRQKAIRKTRSLSGGI